MRLTMELMRDAKEEVMLVIFARLRELLGKGGKGVVVGLLVLSEGSCEVRLM